MVVTSPAVGIGCVVPRRHCCVPCVGMQVSQQFDAVILPAGHCLNDTALSCSKRNSSRIKDSRSAMEKHGVQLARSMSRFCSRAAAVCSSCAARRIGARAPRFVDTVDPAVLSDCVCCRYSFKLSLFSATKMHLLRAVARIDREVIAQYFRPTASECSTIGKTHPVQSSQSNNVRALVCVESQFVTASASAPACASSQLRHRPCVRRRWTRISSRFFARSTRKDELCKLAGQVVVRVAAVLVMPMCVARGLREHR